MNIPGSYNRRSALFFNTTRLHRGPGTKNTNTMRVGLFMSWNIENHDEQQYVNANTVAFIEHIEKEYKLSLETLLSG